jgi:hypothetical protein
MHSRKEIVAPPSSSSLKGRRETSAGRTHVLTLAPLDLATNIIPGIASTQGNGGGTTVTTARLCEADRIPAIRDTFHESRLTVQSFVQSPTLSA